MAMDAVNQSLIEQAGRNILHRYGQYFNTFAAQLTSDTLSAADDSTFSFVHLRGGAHESVSIWQLARSGNATMDKMLTVFGSLSLELERLAVEARRRFYPALLLYGQVDTPATTSPPTEWSGLQAMSDFLPLLQELSVYVQRCYVVTRNCVHQLTAVYRPPVASKQIKPVMNIKDFRLDCFIGVIGRLLSVLISMDQIIQKNTLLLTDWASYMKAVQMAHNDPTKFAISEEELTPLDNVLAKIESQLMNGYIFQNCVEQPFDTVSGLSTSENMLFSEKLLSAIRNLYALWDKRFADENTDGGLLMDCVGLLLMHCFIFRNPDKKTLRTIWESYKKLPTFHIAGNILWTPCEYLAAKVPGIDKKTLASVVDHRKIIIQERTMTLVRDCQASILAVSEWTNQMMAVFRCWPKTNIVVELDRRWTLLIRGYKLALKISRVVKLVLNGHLLENKPMQKSIAVALFRLAELLKAIEQTFASVWTAVLESTGHMIQRWTGELLRVLGSAGDMLRADAAHYSDERVDTLSAVIVAQHMLGGAPTRERWLMLDLALNIGCHHKLLRSDEVDFVIALLWRGGLLMRLGAELRAVCDCSFLFWHRNFLPVYYETLLAPETPAESSRLPYLFAVLQDWVALGKRVRYGEQQTGVTAGAIETEIITSIEQQLLSKVCESVENDLRLSIHTHLQLQERNPLTASAGPPTASEATLAALLALPALRVGGRYLDAKNYVERYLERTFYDLTTVAPHDWRTYRQMAQLALSRYGLRLVDNHLPNNSLDQGLDVLEIMRYIHVFVATYNYHLNTQSFIEKESKSRHLNTLNVAHVANSIRMHGTGVMNTTVNFTYQFLKRKFYIFSQFLYDDHIKSQLVKDVRFFKDRLDELNRKYPIERAEKFNRGIRKLGVKDGMTYLDQFRMLITQIGNAMGYVRLVRSGGLQACSEAMQFVPDLEDIVPLAPFCQETKLSMQTQTSAENVDTLLQDLVKNFGSGTEYFKLLVDVFSTEFRNYEKYSHLKNFYVIIPPLTVNFVEHMLTCKERIGKRGQQHGYTSFTDDGFCTGVAYILKLLDQYEDFDSLHWFQSTLSKCIAEKAQILQDQKKGTSSGQDDKLQQALALKVSRLEIYQREYDLVSFGLRSARIFFRSDVNKEIIPKEDKDLTSDSGSMKSEKSSTRN